MGLQYLSKRTAVQQFYGICIFTVADVYRCCRCRCFMRMQVSMFFSLRLIHGSCGSEKAQLFL
jgi:hypothetical protein